MKPVLESKSKKKGNLSLYMKNSVRNQIHAKNILLFAYPKLHQLISKPAGTLRLN